VVPERKNMTQFQKWFDTFLSEKELPYEAWDLTAKDGTPHHIDSDVVIEAIKGASSQEQESIKAMVVKIDFVNGNVNHYFQHLAQALVSRY